MSINHIVAVIWTYTAQKADSSLFGKDFPMPAYKRRGNTLTVPNSQTGLAVMLSYISSMTVFRSYENHNGTNGRHNHNARRYDGKRFDSNRRRAPNACQKENGYNAR